MTVQAKICGINSPIAMKAAIEGGASYIGLVFYPRSPRAVTVTEAAHLAKLVPGTVQKVGLFVNITDDLLNSVLDQLSLDILQLHGKETPERVSEIKDLTGLPVMKAIHIENSADFSEIERYTGVADQILFDAKVPKNMKNALPGGNAISFDWALFGNRPWQKNWMLSGGLTANNVGEAIRISGAQSVDVSSGVETMPGQKDIKMISAFLETVLALS
ncbi:MAG: phosphoribosylanthranilate isomerase [Rhodospirillaceae bacterium]|nr:phosphoribosylanthranilate isomerase [Rhodospirillaceae bacterium]